MHSLMYSNSHILHDSDDMFRLHTRAIIREIQQFQLTLSTSKWFVIERFIQHFTRQEIFCLSVGPVLVAADVMRSLRSYSPCYKIT